MKEFLILDVGDAQSIGLKTKNDDYVLLDFGDSSKNSENFNRIFNPFFKNKNQILLILSHFHEDHYLYSCDRLPGPDG